MSHNSRSLLAAFVFGLPTLTAVNADAGVMVKQASFGLPNEVLIDPGHLDGDQWASYDNNSIAAFAGPTKFHPDWGTLTGVKLQVTGEGIINWDASNEYGWMGVSGVWAKVGIGVNGQVYNGYQSVDAVSPVDSGVLNPEVNVGPLNMDVNDFVGYDPIQVLTTSEVGYGFVIPVNDWEPDKNLLADLSGSVGGMFVGTITVEYTYTPPGSMPLSADAAKVTAVPLLPAAWAGLATLGGMAAAQYRKRRAAPKD